MQAARDAAEELLRSAQMSGDVEQLTTALRHAVRAKSGAAVTPTVGVTPTVPPTVTPTVTPTVIPTVTPTVTPVVTPTVTQVLAKLEGRGEEDGIVPDGRWMVPSVRQAYIALAKAKQEATANETVRAHHALQTLHALQGWLQTFHATANETVRAHTCPVPAHTLALLVGVAVTCRYSTCRSISCRSISCHGPL